jgi:hypothetical protein
MLDIANIEINVDAHLWQGATLSQISPLQNAEGRFDSPLQHAAVRLVSLLHDAAERVDSPLHHAVGSQTSIVITPRI